jgi:hypothetical protein
MGFSRGSQVALYSGLKRFNKMWNNSAAESLQITQQRMFVPPAEYGLKLVVPPQAASGRGAQARPVHWRDGI